MSEYKHSQVQLEIAQIIERSRHQEEMFLIDSKTAATQILSFLRRENLLPSFSEEILANRQN
jgi:hypothetical protein